MCSACNHFLQNKPFYSTTIFSKIIRDLCLQQVHASMCSACNHCLQTCLFTVLLFFYINTILITITRNIFRLHHIPHPLSIYTVRTFYFCPFNHCLQTCPFTVLLFFTLVLFSLRLLELFFVYKHSMHRCALHVTIFCKTNLFTVLLFLLQLSEIFVYNQYMHRCALHVTTVYKHAFLQYYYFFYTTTILLRLLELFFVYKHNMHRCALHVTIF